MQSDSSRDATAVPVLQRYDIGRSSAAHHETVLDTDEQREEIPECRDID